MKNLTSKITPLCPSSLYNIFIVLSSFKISSIIQIRMDLNTVPEATIYLFYSLIISPAYKIHSSSQNFL
jgi:hypothetical protein